MRVKRSYRNGAAIVLLCAIAGSYIPNVAMAQTPDEIAAARENFKQGLELEKAGKYEEALEKFEATAKVKTTAQVRFHIGLCNEKLGHLGAAIDAYEAAAKQAEVEKNAPEVLKVAPELATKLKAKRAKLTISFADNQVAESLTIDGHAVEGNVAKDYALDPGPHVVIATQGDYKLREEVKLGEGEGKTLTLKFGGSATETVDTPAYDHPAENPKDRPDEGPKSSSSTRTIGWVIGGFGVVSLALSGAFYGVHSSAKNDLEGACTADKRCPPSAEDSYKRANTFGTMSIVALGVGVAAVATGAILIITGKAKQQEPVNYGARFVPYAPNANLFGLGIEGAF
jgi:tetratricopeptide (TPR) repeat protein